MGEKNSFAKMLDRIEKQMKKISAALFDTRCLCSAGDMENVYKMALQLEQETENMVLLTRALPAYTGRPAAQDDVEEIIQECFPVEIGYTKQGWFSVRFPLLLPKKEKGSPSYIRSVLYPAMQSFFWDKNAVRFTDCVLIYRHVYSKDRPERQKRDHDNIEINMVSDTVALFTMTDDAPDVCRHYYCSAAAQSERTEVYVVPSCEFTDWLAAEKEMPEEGIKLHEKAEKTAEKDM